MSSVLFVEKLNDKLEIRDHENPALGHSLVSQVNDADQMHGDSIRNDSRRSAEFIVAQRAQTRHFLDTISKEKNRQLPEVRRNQLLGAFSRGLGLQVRGDSMGLPNFRGDALFFPSDLIDRNSEIVRRSNQVRALSENLPVRSFNPGKQLVEVRGIRKTGAVTLWNSGQTDVTHSSYKASQALRKVYHLVTKTQIAWDTALYGRNSDIDVVSEESESAIQNLYDAWERVLANGYANTDLAGIIDLQLPTVVSTLDLSDPSVTIGQAYADFIGAMLQIEDINDERGGLGNTLFIAPKLLRKLFPLNNFAGGGDATGADLFAALSKNDMALGKMYQTLGITNVIKAPALNNWGGDATKAAAVVLKVPSSNGSLRQLIGMAPAPVRTASTLTHDETLFAMTIGGVEAPSVESTGVYVGKVA